MPLGAAWFALELKNHRLSFKLRFKLFIINGLLQETGIHGLEAGIPRQPRVKDTLVAVKAHEV